MHVALRLAVSLDSHAASRGELMMHVRLRHRYMYLGCSSAFSWKSSSFSNQPLFVFFIKPQTRHTEKTDQMFYR